MEASDWNWVIYNFSFTFESSVKDAAQIFFGLLAILSRNGNLDLSQKINVLLYIKDRSGAPVSCGKRVVEAEGRKAESPIRDWRHPYRAINRI